MTQGQSLRLVCVYDGVFRVRLALSPPVGEKRVILLHTVEEVQYEKYEPTLTASFARRLYRK